MLRTLTCVTLLTLASLPVLAEEPAHHPDHSATEEAEMCSDHSNASMEMPLATDMVVAAWQNINLDMHAAMSVDFTGDPDTDFMKGMIPHHQGAIDMALLLMEQGTDAETRALASAIIRTQEEEIAMMQAWLAARADR